jgi:hypothetical protein
MATFGVVGFFGVFFSVSVVGVFLPPQQPKDLIINGYSIEIAAIDSATR